LLHDLAVQECGAGSQCTTERLHIGCVRLRLDDGSRITLRRTLSEPSYSPVPIPVGLNTNPLGVAVAGNV